jgi:hypothetical protein
MIMVRVTLHSARTGKVTELGRMTLSNDGITTAQDNSVGSYIVEVLRKGDWKRVTRRGRVERFPRKAYNIWRLITRALLDAFPEENPRAPALNR